MRPIIFVTTFWRNRFNQELGPLYLVSVLRKNGWDAEVAYRARGDSDCFFEIANKKPLVVGFSLSHKYTGLEPVRVGAGILKSLIPDVHLTVGGPFVSSNWRNVLKKYSSIDSVIIGEAEDTIIEFVDVIQNGLTPTNCRGIAYRCGDELRFNGLRTRTSQINKLPWPVRDYIGEYLADNQIKSVSMSGSRGCIGNCSFCNVPLMYSNGPPLRNRSINDIVDEMEFLCHDYGVSVISFTDSSFEDMGKQNLRTFADEIIKRKLRIAYGICLRAETFNNDTEEIYLIKKLVQSGLYQILVGFEASEDESLNYFNKRAHISDNEKFMNLFNKFEIHIAKGFMMFTPHTTIDMLYHQLEFIKKMDFVHELIFMTTQTELYEGTPLVNQLISEGLLKADYDWEELFPYRFIDPHVEKISKLMRTFRNHDTIMDEMEYSEYFGRIYYLIKRIFPFLESDVLESYHSLVKQLQKRLANENYIFFRKVIDLAARDLPTTEFNKYQEEYLNNSFKPILSQMHEVDKKFSASLLYKHPEVEDELSKRAEKTSVKIEFCIQ